MIQRILSRVKLFRPPPQRFVIDCGGTEFPQEVASQQHRQWAMRVALADEGRLVTAYLRTHPEKRADPSAIQVLSLRGSVLGYIPDIDADVLAPQLRSLEQAHYIVSCRGRIHGGEGDLAVRLSLDHGKVRDASESIGAEG